jgi:phosphonate transport system substrate-binding protein
MKNKHWLLLVAMSSVAFAQKSIVFAPLPMQKPDEVVAQVRPMLKYLEQEVGATIQIRYFSSYQAITDAFIRGEVDLTYLGPLPYVRLRQHDSAAEPIVYFKEIDGKAAYSCALAALNASVLDKQPMTIALTQPLSTCGYLSVRTLLKHNNKDIEAQHYRYVGAHDKAVLSVASGEFDAAGAKTAIVHKYENLGVRILQETPPMPAFALVANQATLDSKVVLRLRDALLKLDPIQNAAVMAAWGDAIRNGSVAAKDEDYRAVREIVSHETIPDKGNF